MSENIEALDEVENRAYHLIFRLNFTERDAANTLKAELSDQGLDPFLADLAVAEALSYRHQQALRGELDYHAWLSAVAERPSDSGPEVLALALFSAFVAFLTVWAIGSEMRGKPGARLAVWFFAFVVGGGLFGAGSYPVFLLKNHRSSSPKDPN